MILGESMEKDLNGWNLSQKAKNSKFRIRLFSGAKLDCMKLLLRENSPRSLTIHVGTYNVSNEGKF